MGKRDLVGRLLEAHEAGLVTLPNEVVEVASAIQRLRAETADAKSASLAATDAIARVEHEVAQEAVEAALADKPMPSGERYVEARAMIERLAFEARALERAVSIAQAELEEVVGEHAWDIVVNGLRPPFDKVIAQARELEPQLKGALERSQVDSEEQWRAWTKLSELSGTYARLRRLWADVLHLSGQMPQHQDENGYYAELRDAERWVPRTPGARSQIPTETPARLAFIAMNAGPWLPLPSERDERWMALLKETGELERRQRAQEFHARWAHA